MTYFQVANGEVIEPIHMNTAINQGVVPFVDAAARDSAIPSPVAGMTCYLLSTSSLQSYTGAAWVGNPPAGTIVAHGGAVPPGWHLCNGSAHGSPDLEVVLGSASAPDLRDRFVIAAGSTYEAATTGGAATHVLSVAEMPVHHHWISLEYGGGVDPGQPYPGQYTQVRSGGANYPTWLDAAISDTGGNAEHNNMPPYYSLAYIIKK